MDQKKKNFAVAALRRSSYRWPGRYQAMKEAHKARNEYLCAACDKIFPRKEINLDHIEPIVPVAGFKNGEVFDFNEYIDRLLVEKEGFQVLCSECHSVKTKTENSTRKENKKKTSKKRK
jgi:5-methylcytosine-specific restriction endonuclease McrA